MLVVFSHDKWYSIKNTVLPPSYIPACIKAVEHSSQRTDHSVYVFCSFEEIEAAQIRILEVDK